MNKKKKRLIVSCRMYFGAPGSGKTTLAVAEAIKASRRGIAVFTNFPVPGCYKIDPARIGVQAPRNALVIIDEAGLEFGNRDWKGFPKTMLSYIKLHRHYGTSFVFLSQSWNDCDKKIRDICTEYWLVHKFGPLTWRRLLRKRVGINDVDKQIIDEYYRMTVFQRGLSLCWRPHWYRYYNSWDAPALPDYPRQLW